MLLVIPLMTFALTPPDCRALQRDMIFARDVAALAPAFARVPGDYPLGYMLDSGAPRILHGVDLQRIARNQGVELDGLTDVCFTRQIFVLQVGQIHEAMESALNVAGLKIEILSSSQHPVPSGELVFPRAGLQLPVSGTAHGVLWRGYVRDGQNRTFPVWATVRITAPVTRIVATANIPAGKPIQTAQVRMENTEDFPLDESLARNLDDVRGYLPRVSLHAGASIRKTQLDRPTDVTRGDLVEVQVFAGAAHLVFQARAESAGVKGTTVLVRNLASGKDFQALVTGKDQVSTSVAVVAEDNFK